MRCWWRSRGDEPGTRVEFELFDAIGEAFRSGRYFDVFIEYAKAAQEDILCRITAVNRGPEPAALHILPHLWFRNSWSWGYSIDRPELRSAGCPARPPCGVNHKHLGNRFWYADVAPAATRCFCSPRTRRTWSGFLAFPTRSRYVKDAFHEAVIGGQARPGQRRRIRHQGRGALPVGDSTGRDRWSSAPGSWTGHSRSLRWIAIRSSTSGGKRPTRFTTRCIGQA